MPFHFWLPGAMAAPTPVSAYLHAAAMVKAGVYLVAVLAPALAGVPGWRPAVWLLGALTLFLGGWRALRQDDLKLLLAYGTVSQLGFLVLLLGTGTQAAALGGLAMVIAHALFKATLFLVVGIVDHSAGTRQISELSGLGGQAQLPVTATIAAIAGASMAGLPPTLGFIAKEAGLEGVTNLALGGDGTQLAPLPAWALTAVIVAGSAITVAYSLRFWWGAFAPKPGVARDQGQAPADGRVRGDSRALGPCLPGGWLPRRAADRRPGALRGDPAHRRAQPRPHAVARLGTVPLVGSAAGHRRWASSCSGSATASPPCSTPSHRCPPPPTSTGRPCGESTGSPSRSPIAPSAARWPTTSPPSSAVVTASIFIAWLAGP